MPTLFRAYHVSRTSCSATFLRWNTSSLSSKCRKITSHSILLDAIHHILDFHSAERSKNSQHMNQANRLLTFLKRAFRASPLLWIYEAISWFMRPSHGWIVSGLPGIRSIPIDNNAHILSDADLDGATTSLNNATVFPSPGLNKLREYTRYKTQKNTQRPEASALKRDIPEHGFRNPHAARWETSFSVFSCTRIWQGLAQEMQWGWLGPQSLGNEMFHQENFIGQNIAHSHARAWSYNPSGGAHFAMDYVDSSMEIPVNFQAMDLL